MEESCKDCVYMTNIKDKVITIEVKVDDIEDRTVKLERKNDVAIEKFNTITTVLKDIKDSINKVNWLIISAVVLYILNQVVKIK